MAEFRIWDQRLGRLRRKSAGGGSSKYAVKNRKSHLWNLSYRVSETPYQEGEMAAEWGLPECLKFSQLQKQLQGSVDAKQESGRNWDP